MNKIKSLLYQLAAECPDRSAIQCGDRRISYRELVRVLESFAQIIGPLSGMRILLLLSDGIPAYLCHLSSFIGGATVVPVSVQSTTSAMKRLCERVKPHLVVTNNPLRMRHMRAIIDLPCLVARSDKTGGLCGYDFELIGAGKTGNCRQAPCSSIPDEVRMIVFTSGSTGEPKGVCLSEQNLLSAAQMMVSFLSLDPLRRSLVTVPMYDYYGFIQIYGHILGQCGYIIGESICFPDQLFGRICQDGITDLVLVPFTLRQMHRSLTGKCHDAIRKLRFMTSSSDVLGQDLLEQTFALNPDLEVFNIYGLTEAGRACYRRIDRFSVPSNSIGLPSPGVNIVIDGPAGEPGEIIIRGPNVMLGYLQDINGDRVCFRPCTEMRTGDLGYYDKNGEVVLMGRREHMINVMGSKIHPAEIETIALLIPGVTDAIARAHRNDGSDVIIELDVVAASDSCDVSVIREHMRQNLPHIFFPQTINLVPQIKRTELGSKIVRH